MNRQLGFSLLALLALSATVTCSAEAGPTYLTGSIGFTADSIVANNTDATTATDFTFATTAGGAGTQITTAGPTGSFMGVPAATVIGSSALDLSAAGGSAAPYLTLTLDSDSFTATKFLSSSTPGNNSRVIELSGLISGPGFLSTPADFTLTFSQSGGAGNAIAYGGSLSATSVPEPGSMLLMGLGLIGALVVSRRRLDRLSRHSA